MDRFIAAFALACMLASCTGSSGGSGGDVLQGEDAIGIGDCQVPTVPDDDETCPEDDTSGSDTPVTPESSDQYLGYLNNITYDEADGSLVLNNMPYDGDNVYARNAAVSDTSDFGASTSFDVYNNTSGTTNYFAVFRRSDEGYAQVAALGTNRYITFGFSGAGAERVAGSGSGALPSAETSYIFDGEYAAVRTITSEDQRSVIQYVSGTIQLDVDTNDFDGEGRVEGVVTDRYFFDTNGNELFNTDTNPTPGARDQEYISMTTGVIDFDNWTVSSTSGSAQIVINDAVANPEDGATVSADSASRVVTGGDWSALFAGPNGEEIAGVVFIEGTGPVGIDTSTGQTIILTEDTIREVGTFVATR